MRICTRLWIRHCLKCEALKTSRLTVRWPVISMLLPEGPGIAVSVDYVGPLPVTRRGNTYILLFTDRFSRRADMYAVTAAEFTAEGTANIFINRYIPSGDARAAYSQTTASSFAPSLRRRSTSFLAFGKLPPAPTTQMVMGGACE